MEKDKNRPEGEQAYNTENRPEGKQGCEEVGKTENADRDGNQTMREQIDKDCRSQERRKQIERDVYLHNKYENPDYLNRTMPESARWHWQRKPYDGKYK